MSGINSNGISENDILAFAAHLAEGERAAATIEKYGGVIRDLANYLGGRELTKQSLVEYREHLLKSRTPQTVNGSLGAIHSFLKFMGRGDCRVKTLKVQRQAFLDANREMTEEEYHRLLATAERQGKRRLWLVMQTLGCTGIRIGELVYITVEAVRSGRADIRMKGKCRSILLPEKLRCLLAEYAADEGIAEGHVFRTRSGRPLDRSNVCHEMKRLCEDAGVDRTKVFPHSFRHLFARKFYELEKDLARLADILGHSRIETTRLYVAVTAAEHEKVLNRMGMVYVVGNRPRTDPSVVEMGAKDPSTTHRQSYVTPKRDKFQ